MAGLGSIGHDVGESSVQGAEHATTSTEEHAFSSAAHHAPEPEGHAAQQAATAKLHDLPPMSHQAAAPIMSLPTAAETNTAASRFEYRVNRYAGDRQGNPVEVPPAVHKGELSLKNLGEKRDRKEWKADNAAWQQRSQSATGIANSIKLSSGVEEGMHAYKLGDEPVALMKLDHKDGTEIKWLTAHPGVSGAGQSMVEKAVSESTANNHGGVVKVVPRDESAGFYKSLGFKGNNAEMTLDPAKSKQWSQQEDGSWGLKANQDKGYLAARPDEASSDDEAGPAR